MRRPSPPLLRRPKDLRRASADGNGTGRAGLVLLLLKLGLALLAVLAACGSLLWMASISASSRVGIYKGYRRLQERLAVDLSVLGELSVTAATRGSDLGFCPPEYENYVPCYHAGNLSVVGCDRDCDGKEGSAPRRRCLIMPPKKYRIPMRWPTARDFVWKENVRITGQEFSHGSLTKRMMVEEEHISFHSESLMVDGVEDYAHQIAEMIGLSDESSFNQAGIRTILDIGCGFGSFGAYLFSKHLLTLCIANFEVSGSQVQLTLERGLPAIVASFAYRQLPFPYLSFDMLHCARCGVDWEVKDGALLVEMDRLLRPGGYFVWTSSLLNPRSLHVKEKQKTMTLIQDFTERLCWELLSQQDETVIWKKTNTKSCYDDQKSRLEFCGKGRDVETPYYRPLQSCIGGTRSQRWVPTERRTPWPSRAALNSSELQIYGVDEIDFREDAIYWKSVISNYWSLLSPLIFSDHPKRPGDEDPSPPFNMVRNVVDMNARYGGFNAALREAGKAVWVMNVVPTASPDYLPLILDRGFIGVRHDWCEAFPTYPRTYDLVHAEGLLSLEKFARHKCTILDLFLEIDRILRPEGWMILKDKAGLVESVRYITSQLKWDTRMMDLASQSGEKILICQKPFLKKQ